MKLFQLSNSDTLFRRAATNSVKCVQRIPNLGHATLVTQIEITKLYVYCLQYTYTMGYTVFCNQMGTVFTEMSSWTALTWHIDQI